MADESLLERLVHLKSMVDKGVGDPPTDDDASSPALLDAYMRIRAEVGEFVHSLSGDEEENLTGEDSTYGVLSNGILITVFLTSRGESATLRRPDSN